MRRKNIPYSACKTQLAKGFTLIEILVSTAVMVVITGLILTITSGVLGIWNRSAGAVEASREARLLLTLIEDDLDGILFNAPGEIINYQTETIGTGAFSLANQARLIVLSSVPAAPSEEFDGDPVTGNICAVAYELTLREIFPGTASSRNVSIYRGLVDPLTTFSGNAAFDGFIGESDVSGGITLRTIWDGNIESGSPSDAVSGNVGIYSTGLRRNLAASNVIDFSIQFYRENATSLAVSAINPTSSVSVENGTLYINGVATADRLAYMDITFTVLSNEGMTTYFRHVDNLESTYADAQEIALAFGETFTRRIALIATR